MVDLKYAIGLKPEKAVEYLKSKGFTFSWDWHETWQEAHAKAFTVAKAMDMDILQDIREMVRQSIEQGITFKEFQKGLEPQLRAKGWWGRKVVKGPDGNDQEVQLGSPLRLKTIYRTNLQTSYMAGRYKEQIDNSDDRPWWQYNAVLDMRTRASHAALHGKVFRHDDPFWDTHYPPNGWGCRCRVRALNKDEIDEKEIKPETAAGRITMEDRVIDEKGGKTMPVAVYHDPLSGIRTATDPGWSYNPGKAAWQPDLDNYSYDVARKFLEGAVTGPDFTRFFEGKVKGVYPVAVLDEAYRGVIGAKTQVVTLSDETLAKNKAEHRDIKIEDYRRLPDIIENAQLIVQDREMTLVFVKRGEKIYRSVVKSTESGKALFMTSLRQTNIEDVRRTRSKGVVLKDEFAD